MNTRFAASSNSLNELYEVLMKTKTLAMLLVFATAGATSALASHDWRPSVGHGRTVYHAPPRTVTTTTTTVTHYYHSPVVYHQVRIRPAPVYHAPPVYVRPAPVYHPAPVYVQACPPPTYVRPRFSFGFYF
jgi:hypothetical protein